MSAVAFDTLKFVKTLRNAGFSEDQAEAQAEAFAAAIDMNLATKQDIVELKSAMIQMESRLIIQLGSICVVSVGVVTAIVKLF